ncbi:MAG: mechanosensitive ion channel protein MscS [Bacteroidetes bacterium MedPE-SWsnd-G2]|nr:MAG: mechanosensitive ion channel protein MscS [Bacteroidetes bacterium MedPE-SWsnd-G2]
MDKLKAILDYSIEFTDGVTMSVRDLVILIAVLLLAKYLIRFIRNLVTRKLDETDRMKFRAVFSYSSWFIYIIIFLVTFHTLGVNVTGIFAASAALLIGVGLALQTLFQDIISGMFILIDKSVSAGDIIELEGKIGRVEEITLRSTRAVTRDNKVLIIPNHLFLTNSLFNHTQNNKNTRESVEVGVAYGSDLELVSTILIEVAKSHNKVLKKPAPKVMFTQFGDSSLNFKLWFTISDSFKSEFTKSDLRFEIDKKFREQNISIPFPQRDVHVYKNID